MGTDGPGPVGATIRRLLVPVYLPWLAVGLGLGVLLPALPLYLRSESLSYTTVSVVLAAAGAGSALGSLPAGAIGQRIGDDGLMALAVATLAITTVLFGVATSVVVLVVLRVAYGAGQVALHQSRQTFITRTVPVVHRGRVMSWVGGTFRLALLVGPVLGGLVVDRAGFATAFVVAGGLTALGLLGVERGTLRSVRCDVAERSASVPLRAALRRHRRRLVTVGIGPALIMAARDGRHVVIPLIADSFDMSASAVGAVVAVGTGADLVLFPVAGLLMDRFGRLFAIVPSFSLMAVGLLLIGLADTTTGVVVGTIVTGVGNGMSAGTMLTYGSDLAPADDPGPFLAGLNVMTYTGRVVGPLLVGWFADAVGLGTSAVALSVVLAVGVAWIVVIVGETGGRAAEDDAGTAAPRPSPGPAGSSRG